MQKSFNFGEALVCLKQGLKVKRNGWNGKGIAEETPKVQDCLCMYTAQETVVVGWLASQSDLLADDWIVVV